MNFGPWLSMLDEMEDFDFMKVKKLNGPRHAFQKNKFHTTLIERVDYVFKEPMPYIPLDPKIATNYQK